MDRTEYAQRLHLAQLDLEGALWQQDEKEAAALAERLKAMALEPEFAELPNAMHQRAQRLLALVQEVESDIRRRRLEFEDRMRRMMAAAAKAEIDGEPEDHPLH